MDTPNPLSLLTGPIYAWMYFSAIMTTAFYGISCMQTFFYYVHYEKDHLRLKIFVAIVWILNTFHEALIVAGAYRYIRDSLANPLALFNWVPELNLQVLPTALIAALTQGYLMHRIYIFSGWKIITLLVWIALTILQLVPSFVYVVRTLSYSNGFNSVDITMLNDKSLTDPITLSLSVAAGEDILIAMFLVFLLIRERASTVFASTEHMLQRLIVIAVNTGTWSALFALLTIVFMYVLPSKMIYALFALPLCSVYTNTVLANLNARAYLRDRPGTHDVLLASTSLGSDVRRGEMGWKTSSEVGVRTPSQFASIPPVGSLDDAGGNGRLPDGPRRG